jgi:thiol-disulfide isomerase/thioredoxin
MSWIGGERLIPAVFAALLIGSSPAALGELKPGTPAPELPAGAIWIGTQGPHPSMRQLHGKVVIVDFWDYTCINCIRTFPHLKQLYARYHKDGLEIIGVHKGEFGFASEAKNVERAYGRFQLPYPAIADVRDEVWRVYKCNTWPDTFFIDRAGVIAEVHQGEGDYGKEERLVQELLKQGHPELDFSGAVVSQDSPLYGMQCGPMSPEIMIGTKFGSLGGGGIANAEGFQQGRVVTYQPTERRPIRGFFAEGPWKNRSDDFEAAEDPASGRTVSLGISYRARDVYAVLDRGTREPVDVVLTRDGKPIPEAQRGKDIRVLPDGQTVLTIDEPRMYYLVTDEDDTRAHEIVLSPSKKGARICSFTFGNRCLEDFERL